MSLANRSARPAASKQRFFRLLAMVLVPLAILGLLEACLRLSGFGHPASFFIPKKIQGQSMLIENAWFGLRFFPPALARCPNPIQMPAEKPPKVFRIFLFGESAAMGDPRPSYGAGRCLQALLQQRYPDVDFEVICTAMTAINSHAIVPIARDCSALQGDLWIVYMGNNEYCGPFGASTVFGSQAPPLWMVRSFLALEKLRLGQWISAMARNGGLGKPTPAAWGGLKMFKEFHVPPSAGIRDRIQDHFKQNLESILQAGIRAGAPIILSSVAVNLKDCPPFGSAHDPELTGANASRWSQLVAMGETNALSGNWAEAAKWYREAAQTSPRHAETQFRLGQCLLQLTNIDEARVCFELARDYDAAPFRADSKINGIIAEAGLRHTAEGVHAFDSGSALKASGGIPGEDTFLEHVHLNFEGNYLLALGWADQVAKLLPLQTHKPAQAAWASKEDVGRALGLSDWNLQTIGEEMVRRMSDAPFTNQFNHSVRMQNFQHRLDANKRKLRPQAAVEARKAFEDAIARHPRDHWLHHNYAEFLAAVGDATSAVRSMESVRDLIPFNHAAYFQLGRLYARLKRYPEARQSFLASLALRPDLAEVYLELGQVCHSEGKYEDAARHYTAAQTQKPDDARAHLLMAYLQEKQNKRTEAIQSLREAIRRKPGYFEARNQLGIELGLENKFAEAQAEFREAVRIRPDDAESHLNLGIALARCQEFDEAIVQLEASLQLAPGNATAREMLESVKAFKTGAAIPSR